MPGSCSDLRQSGNVISGFYLIMGTQFVEAVYCTFSPLSPGGKFGNILANIESVMFVLRQYCVSCSIPNNDWECWRTIVTRHFLRSKEPEFLCTTNRNSIRHRSDQYRQRHGDNIWCFHGSQKWNLFLFLVWTCQHEQRALLRNPRQERSTSRKEFRRTASSCRFLIRNVFPSGDTWIDSRRYYFAGVTVFGECATLRWRFALHAL